MLSCLLLATSDSLLPKLGSAGLDPHSNLLTWMWVSMEESCVQQLLEVAYDPHIDQIAHIICLALTQLLTIQPLLGQHTTAGQLTERARNYNLKQQSKYCQWNKTFHMRCCLLTLARLRNSAKYTFASQQRAVCVPYVQVKGPGTATCTRRAAIAQRWCQNISCVPLRHNIGFIGTLDDDEAYG